MPFSVDLRAAWYNSDGEQVVGAEMRQRWTTAEFVGQWITHELTQPPATGVRVVFDLAVGPVR